MESVAELRAELVELGLSREEADGVVGKANVRAKIEELKVTQESDDMFDNVVVDEDEEVGTVAETPLKEDEEVEPERPEMSDPKWSDFVLSHLEENEKIKGHPKADSLRRLTELLVGQVVSVDNGVIQCPNLENERRATVTSRITVECYDGSMQAFSGSADVGPQNTESLFAKFPVATAETRAEGRAFRKILRLINVVTAEEVVDESQIYDPADSITDNQIMMIDQMCSTSKLNIDIEKLLELHDVKVEGLDRVTKSKAQGICKIINSYQELKVPSELVGYKNDWR